MSQTMMAVSDAFHSTCRSTIATLPLISLRSRNVRASMPDTTGRLAIRASSGFESADFAAGDLSLVVVVVSTQLARNGKTTAIAAKRSDMGCSNQGLS